MSSAETTKTAATVVEAGRGARMCGPAHAQRPLVPPFRFSDLWAAPLHDLPLRNEMLFENMQLDPAATVLEVGPGSGFTTFLLSHMVREVCSLDVGKDQIDDLETKLASATNVNLVCANICDPSTGALLAGEFDSAFCLDVLEYLPKPGVFFSNLFRLLRPGGQLLVSYPNVPPPQGDGVTWFQKRAELEQLISNAGFRRFELSRLVLNNYAAALYSSLHEWPLRFLRWARSGNRGSRPQAYNQTWAFKNRHRAQLLKPLLHFYWETVLLGLRLVRPVFRKEPLGEDILNNQILILATR